MSEAHKVVNIFEHQRPRHEVRELRSGESAKIIPIREGIMPFHQRSPMDSERAPLTSFTAWDRASERLGIVSAFSAVLTAGSLILSAYLTSLIIPTLASPLLSALLLTGAIALAFFAAPTFFTLSVLTGAASLIALAESFLL